MNNIYSIFIYFCVRKQRLSKHICFFLKMLIESQTAKQYRSPLTVATNPVKTETSPHLSREICLKPERKKEKIEKWR